LFFLVIERLIFFQKKKKEANKAGALLALIAGDITNDRTEEQVSFSSFIFL